MCIKNGRGDRGGFAALGVVPDERRPALCILGLLSARSMGVDTMGNPDVNRLGTRNHPRSTMKSEIGLGSPQEYTSIPWLALPHRPISVSNAPLCQNLRYMGDWMTYGRWNWRDQEKWPERRAQRLASACPKSPWSRGNSSFSRFGGPSHGWSQVAGCWWIFPPAPRLKTLHD